MFKVSAIDPDWIEVYERLLARMEQAKDDLRSTKIREIIDKFNDPAIEVAFCGHFSAGKSSLVNHLCGSALLPSSPIPTSANVVTIRAGDQQATVRHIDGNTERITLDQLEAYCKDGEQIAEITIEHPLEQLGDQIVLLDTPGIDSTDDAHQLATNAVLHRADVVFYVMDYNHVQSEHNFTFIKRLIEQGKPVYLVINQIDKHREQEVAFRTYRETVLTAFHDWGIEPEDVFFISLRNLEHPYNQLTSLLELIRTLPKDKASLKQRHALHTSRLLVDEHLQFLLTQESEIRDELEQQIADKDVEQRWQMLATKQEEHANLLQAGVTLREQLKQEIQRLIDYANITPAKTRDLAQVFLESCQPGFKVGWLSTQAKTEAEKQHRLQSFAAEFSEQVKIHLHYHLMALLQQTSEQISVHSSDAQKILESFESPVTPDWLVAQVHPGAVVSGEYTLNYCNKISAAVKSAYRQQAFQMMEWIVEQVMLLKSAEIQQVEQEIHTLTAELTVVEKLRQMDERLVLLQQEYTTWIDALAQKLQSIDSSSNGKRHTLWQWEDEEEASVQLMAHDPSLKQVIEATMVQEASKQQTKAKVNEAASQRWKNQLRKRLIKFSERLHQAALHLQDMSALRSVTASLNEKASRLASSRYTLALFGAFSAGKSSFANALIGEAVLPVSPNPTTAAINRIVMPKAGWEHKTAKIVMKTRQRLEEELCYSLDRLGMKVSNLSEALQAINELRKEDEWPLGTRVHYSFLQAVAKGWEREQSRLGTEWKADYATYRSYAAVESQSCFVEEIELHYACELTESGMELVDTPGADSIHARHTGVAFNYIKHADAILYVTYYNHAFSQADREFLNQLGRVKDSFELDKMFFLVNAADLATSEQELEQVIEHVKENLTHHGIHHPRIYAISSALALEAKMKADPESLAASRFESFEQRFYSFIYEELSDLLIQSATADMDRALTALQRWQLEVARTDHEKQEQIKGLQQTVQAWIAKLQAEDISAMENELGKEIHELIFYMKQRISYRFGELYQLAFNPASLRTDHRKLGDALMVAWKELESLISMTLSQEMLATTLRIERFMMQQLTNRQEQWQKEIQQQIAGFTVAFNEYGEQKTPEVDEKLAITPPESRRLLGLFKNARHFFEGEGSKQLKMEAESRLDPAIDQYMEVHQARFMKHYVAELQELVNLQTRSLKSMLMEYTEGLLMVMDTSMNQQVLQEKWLKLEQLRAELQE